MNLIRMDASLFREDKGVSLSLLGHRNHKVRNIMCVKVEFIHIIQVSLAKRSSKFLWLNDEFSQTKHHSRYSFGYTFTAKI